MTAIAEGKTLPPTGSASLIRSRSPSATPVCAIATAELGAEVETELGKKSAPNKQIKMWPSTRGAKNWPHAAFNPDTGLLYADTMHVGMLYKHLESKPHVVGQRYT